MRKPNHDGVLAAASHSDAPGMYLIYTGDNPMQTQVAGIYDGCWTKIGRCTGI